jgi:alkaline phosphatase
MKKIILVILTASLVACGGDKPENKTDSPLAKNIIFLIGDGMGLSTVSKATQLHKEALNLERATVIGLSKTSSAKETITDSAAGATAFSIGEKTFNGAIGVSNSGKSKETILERLAKQNYATGLIATSSITHATPASFYAHRQSRENYYAIAEDMVDAPVTLFIGGGQDHFDKRTNGKKGTPDERDLIAKMKSNGVTMLSDLASLRTANGRVGYFTAGSHPDSILKGRNDILPRSIQPTIKYLKKQSEQGFFMMVEGSQIDWGSHENNLEYTLSEFMDFDAAVGEALDFAERDGNTLVVITADHETGGLTLPPSDMKAETPYAEAGHHFSTIGHTSEMVPVYAFGKGSEHFAGVYENNEIYAKLLQAIGK